MLRVARSTVAILLISFGFASRPAIGQVAPGKTQPDRLLFGTVHVGSTVEGSFRVFFSGDDTAGLSVSVTPPKSVRVISTRLGTQNYGQSGTFVFCDVVISIDTSNVQVLNDSVTLEVGDQSLSIPVAADVKSSVSDATRVLVLGTPFHRFATSDSAMFEPWLKTVEGADLCVDYLEVDESRLLLRDLALSRFDVILLPPEGMLKASDADLDRLDSYLEEGGRVVITAAPFMVGSVDKANRLLEAHGLEMLNTEMSGPQGGAVTRECLADDPLTEGIESLTFRRSCPIRINTPKTARALVRVTADDSNAFAAIASAGKGEVIALAVPIWWTWIGVDSPNSTDNALFFARLLSKPRRGDNSPK